jgi:hypothetical protein
LRLHRRAESDDLAAVRLKPRRVLVSFSPARPFLMPGKPRKTGFSQNGKFY